MKRKLYILGAGGFGRQIELYLGLIPREEMVWDIQGFLDENPEALQQAYSDLKIVGNPFTFPYEPTDWVLIAIANIEIRKKFVAQLQDKVQFASLTAPGVLLGKNVHIGKGVIICPGCHIGSNVIIGDHSIINLQCIVGHDSRIGNYCSLMPQTAIGGGVTLEDEVFTGTQVTISPRIHIPKNSHLGAGSVVIKELPDTGTYFGNPARKVL